MPTTTLRSAESILSRTRTIQTLLEEVREPLLQASELAKELYDEEHGALAETEGPGTRVTHDIADAIKQLHENLSGESYTGVSLESALEDIADIRDFVELVASRAERTTARRGGGDDC